MEKFFKYFIFAILAVVIAKWIIMFLPENNNINNNIQTKTNYVKSQKKIKEVELSLDFEGLKPKIEREYELTKEDIYNYVKEQINLQKEEAKYRLTKEDGFLDWLFGYFTGWRIMWKKAKGLFGSEDNEVKFVSDKFETDVINPGLNDMFENINSYVKNRMKDYYKSVIAITTDYINAHIQELKQQGYTDIQIDTNSIPWSQYIVARGGDMFSVAEITGISSVGLMVGKYVGAKVASIIGPKLLGLVEAKTATIIAGKVASMFELLLAPLIDIGANEVVKAAKYNETKENFEKVIDDIFDEIENHIQYNINYSLLDIKNSIYEELNKQVKITAKEVQ